MIRPKAIVAAALLALGLAAPCRAQLILVKQSTGYTFTLPDLIAASDHVTGLTAQTGTVYLTRVTGTSGAVTKAASTNSISEVDSTNAPGQYTLALTTTETGALGYIKGYYKSGSSDPMSFTIKVVAYDPDSATNLGLSNLDATVSSRSTYAGGAVASVTGNVGGNVVGSVASVTGNVGGNVTGSVGSVTGNVGGNVVGSVASVTGNVGGNVTGSTGSISGVTFPANFASLGITAAGKVSEVVLADTVTTYTGNTPQTGDAFARLGVPIGASISADVQTRSTYAGADTAGTTTLLSRLTSGRAGNLDNLDATVSTRATPASAWDLATSGHTTSGTFGAAMNAAGSAGDPWSTTLPGSYASGTAGYLLGNNVPTLLARIPGTVQPQTGDAYARIGANGAGLTQVVLAAAGLDSVPGIGGMNARQQSDFIAAWLFSVRTGITAGQAGTVTIKSTDGATTYGTATFDANGNIISVSITKANLP